MAGCFGSDREDRWKENECLDRGEDRTCSNCGDYDGACEDCGKCAPCGYCACEAELEDSDQVCLEGVG